MTPDEEKHSTDLEQTMRRAQANKVIGGVPDERTLELVERLYNQRQQQGGLDKINEMVLAGLSARLAIMQGVKTTS